MGTRKSVALQHRGGVANLRGNAFEEFFAVWRVLEALHVAHVPTGLACQLKNCSVDDWVEDAPTERRHFQLKRKRSTRWSEVANEFSTELSKRRAKRASVTLVVGHRATAGRLSSSKQRVPGSEVLLFNRSLKPSEHWSDRRTGAAITRLSIGPTTASERELVWSTIRTAWLNARKPGYFISIQRVIAALPDRTLPLRLPWTPTTRWRAAEKLLRAVSGFSFTLEDGAFTYEEAGGVRGSFSCRTSLFKEFIDRVLKKPPTQLADLRGLF